MGTVGAFKGAFNLFFGEISSISRGQTLDRKLGPQSLLGRTLDPKLGLQSLLGRTLGTKLGLQNLLPYRGFPGHLFWGGVYFLSHFLEGRF